MQLLTQLQQGTCKEQGDYITVTYTIQLQQLRYINIAIHTQCGISRVYWSNICNLTQALMR